MPGIVGCFKRNGNMEKKYNINFDILTILACLMVVFFHCNMLFYDYSDTLSWKTSVIERCIVYSAIPIFFMLTGAKLMEYRKRYSTKEFAKKRLLRVGIPFVFWNVFYILFNTFMGRKFVADSPKEFISMFLNSEFQNRYWFFWPLFAIYATIPVLSLILEAKKHRKYLWYTVYLGFGIMWLMRPVCMLLGIQNNSYITMPMAGGFLVYSIFGYLISTEEWSKLKRIILYISAILSGIFAVVYTIMASKQAGQTVQAMVNYHYFPSGLTGAAIFVFIKHAKLEFINKSEKLIKTIRGISDCCMGVWLTHSMAILVLLKITGLNEDGYIWRFAGAVVVFVLCIVGVKIAKKIPFVKHLV